MDQQAALSWVQKYVSVLVLLMAGIRDRKIILLFSFLLLLPRSVNSAETQTKLRSGEFQQAQVQFYNMLSQMVEKHRHHFSELR